ncbi:MAG: endo-1,4-beta-xylanase [Verrucomicrobia bacterium]|nr:endo-1,4-beta-xylanase [Verrucomicrobiota bacterium]
MRSLRHLPRAAAIFAAFHAAALPALRAQPTLKDTYRGMFHLGAAIRPDQVNGRTPQAAELILREFDSISPENVLKVGPIHPRPGNDDSSYDFAPADQFVDFGVKHKLFTIGHTLCWHSQLPAWLDQQQKSAEPTITKAELTQFLRDHIMKVVGRYKGRVHGWDVVNEALNDGAGGYRQTIFHRVIGQDYLVMAFKWAHEADPAAELYYNDYNLDANDAKRTSCLELIKYLRANGAPITGVGMQGHYNLNTPSAAKVDETIKLFADLGLKVMITELDVRAVGAAPVTGAVGAGGGGGRGRGAPPSLTAEQQQALAQRYADLFAVFVKHRAAITRVTFWGLRDTDSWRRASSPLIFDDHYQPKPAYHAVLNAAKSAGPAKAK